MPSAQLPNFALPPTLVAVAALLLSSQPPLGLWPYNLSALTVHDLKVHEASLELDGHCDSAGDPGGAGSAVHNQDDYRQCQR